MTPPPKGVVVKETQKYFCEKWNVEGKVMSQENSFKPSQEKWVLIPVRKSMIVSAKDNLSINYLTLNLKLRLVRQSDRVAALLNNKSTLP